MKTRLSFDMARYRRYQEPFALRAERARALGEEAGNGSVRVAARRNEQAMLPAADRGSRASDLLEEKTWTTP
jgi:SLT domain-containing protein